MDRREELIKIFAANLRTIFRKLSIDYQKLQEIRLRVNCPVIIIYDGMEYFVNDYGEFAKDAPNAHITTKEEIQETLEYVGNYSLYAYEDELKQGFLTIQGGHRVGIAGKTIVDGQKIRNLKYISYLNIRLSHQIKGCGTWLLPYILNQESIYHTLLISPPRCGKTTLLRDLIRQLSNGTAERKGITIGVIDERSEIGGSYLGIPQNDLGIRTDIMDCCPKSEGMMMLVRSMSPEVIAVDEIGAAEDIYAIETIINCGCRLLATVHGSSMEDMERKPLLKKLVREKIFERYIVLHNSVRTGEVKAVFDECKRPLFQGDVEVC